MGLLCFLQSARCPIVIQSNLAALTRNSWAVDTVMSEKRYFLSSKKHTSKNKHFKRMDIRLAKK